MHKFNHFSNITISPRTHKQVWGKFANSLLSSSSDADAMVALFCRISDKIQHVNFIGIVVDARSHYYNRLLILERGFDAIVFFWWFGKCPIESNGSTFFINEFFSCVLGHVVFLVSIHVLLKYIQQYNLNSWPSAQIVQLHFKISQSRTFNNLIKFRMIIYYKIIFYITFKSDNPDSKTTHQEIRDYKISQRQMRENICLNKWTSILVWIYA
jgi:hypothetical protein